jgi:hypothetical protein
MTAIRHWLATLSVFAFGGITHSYIDAAEAKNVSAAEIERACARALQANSIDALEDFLHRYPPSKYHADVACYALALDALNGFEHNNGGDRPKNAGGNPPSGSGA